MHKEPMQCKYLVDWIYGLGLLVVQFKGKTIQLELPGFIEMFTSFK